MTAADPPAPAAAPAPARAARRWAARNTFYVWRTADPKPTRVDPAVLEMDEGAGDIRYFAGIMRELDAQLGPIGLRFLLTWKLDDFDETLRDAIVILVGDEKYQTPSYAPDVRVIFKTGGTRPNPLRATLATSPPVRWRLVLRDLRNALLAIRRRGLAPGHGAPMFEVPMGYFGLTDVPWLAHEDRPLDVFFAGSIEAGGGFTIRPRLAARREMSRALEHAQRTLRTMRVDCRTAGPFANPADTLDPGTYSLRLMSAKIALCPRGNFDETFRLVEAARSGCVAITERLPERWYYRDCPAVQLDTWRALPQVLDDLLRHPDELAQRAAAMRTWWEQQLSEAAVAAHLVATLARRGDLCVVPP